MAPAGARGPRYLTQFVHEAMTTPPAQPNPYDAPTADLDDEPIGEGDGPILASRWSRLIATVLDHLIVTGPPLAAIFYAQHIAKTPINLDDPLSMGAGYIVAGLFSTAMIIFNLSTLGSRGQTLGKIILGIKMVRSDGYSHVSLWRIVGLRFAPFYLVGRWVPIYGQAVWAVEALTIFGNERKCIHDYVADTMVINEGAAVSPPVRVAPETAAPKVTPEANALDPERLTPIATLDGPADSAFAQAVLAEHKIPCLIDFEPVAADDPLLGSSIGGARLLVDVDDADAAIDALAEAVEEEAADVTR